MQNKSNSETPSLEPPKKASTLLEALQSKLGKSTSFPIYRHPSEINQDPVIAANNVFPEVFSSDDFFESIRSKLGNITLTSFSLYSCHPSEINQDPVIVANNISSEVFTKATASLQERDGKKELSL